MDERGLPLVLENIRRAFSPGPTGSPRMDSTRLKNVCVGRFEVADKQRDLKVELTLLTSVPRSPSVLYTVERGTPYNGLKG